MPRQPAIQPWQGQGRARPSPAVTIPRPWCRCCAAGRLFLRRLCNLPHCGRNRSGHRSHRRRKCLIPRRCHADAAVKNGKDRPWWRCCCVRVQPYIPAETAPSISIVAMRGAASAEWPGLPAIATATSCRARRVMPRQRHGQVPPGRHWHSWSSWPRHLQRRSQ